MYKLSKSDLRIIWGVLQNCWGYPLQGGKNDLLLGFDGELCNLVKHKVPSDANENFVVSPNEKYIILKSFDVFLTEIDEYEFPALTDHTKPEVQALYEKLKVMYSDAAKGVQYIHWIRTLTRIPPLLTTKNTTPANATAAWEQEQIRIGTALNNAADKHPFINNIFDLPYLTGVLAALLAGALIVGGTVAAGGAITCGAVCGPGAGTVLIGSGGAATTPMTQHGAEQMAERGFSEVEILATKTGGFIKTQADGALVYIKEIASGKYNVIVEGEKGIITGLKNIDIKALNNLAKNYGWK